MDELLDFFEDKSIYRGPLTVKTGKQLLCTPVIVSNFGHFVARKGEPSLGRLVPQIAGQITVRRYLSTAALLAALAMNGGCAQKFHSRVQGPHILSAIDY